jgi:phosphoribosylformylglycinamidine synthase subunit PurSL
MIHRIDVRPREVDPLGESVAKQVAELGIGAGRVAAGRIFLIDTDADAAGVRRIAGELLADPVVESAEIFSSHRDEPGWGRIEVHLKPGVMDPVAASTEMAIRDMGLPIKQVRTGRAFLFEGLSDPKLLGRIAERVLANGVIESVHFKPYCPAKFESGREYEFQIRRVELRNLNDEQLAKLSRDGHLFLSLPEMKAIQDYFRRAEREPTDIELETLAQTWSEHCVHKTLKSAVEVEERDASGKVIDRRKYGNLIKETIFQSTMELMERNPGFCLSVFKDNAGVIAFDETDAVCFKVETHNHPSAIEPYGGAATGAGGVIRDVLGTGLAARPIANTDIFCVAYPKQDSPLPRGVIHPKRVLQQIVAGVRDYGNRMGIPTVNGAVYFDDRYLGNPLVFCGCAGILPRNKIEKAAQNGDAIVVMGGRTGRDGIHGATFSSAQLTDTHADEFSHAVQIGNAITEKQVADVILAARDRNLFTAVTDCGAGGLSSAVGEMAEKTGAAVDLEKVPLKYQGLRYDEIWISEAQERMCLSVPNNCVEQILELAASENVEATVIGTFGTENRELILRYRGEEVGRLAMKFLHDGIPMPTRKAVITVADKPIGGPRSHTPPALIKQSMLEYLAHPNIASKHWIIRQYDHEVQGGSVIKPLTGPLQIGPADAAVLRPKLSSQRGIVLSNGMVPKIDDPYAMTIASIDEAIRNAVCVGADPDRLAILDNFCWPSVDDEITMGTIVRACEACRDAALAYGIPFISGKDSLHNQFINQETGQTLRIPRTLLISAIGVIEDVRQCVTMDFKNRTSRVILVESNDPHDPAALGKTHRAVSKLIRSGKIAAAHDVSDGGLAVAAAEMCIASGLGLIAGPTHLLHESAFAEGNGRYLLELDANLQSDAVRPMLEPVARVTDFGLVQHLRKLTITAPEGRVLEIGLDELTAAWRGTLDW